MCIISNSKKFIFIHVPKSAGTSITSYYSAISSCRDIEIGGTQIGELIQPHYQKRFGLSKHSTFDEIDNALGPEVINSFFTFGFVRNPYTRVVSSFTFLRKWNGWNGHDEFLKITDVNDFIQSDFFKGDGVDRQFKPQSHWLGGNIIDKSNKVSYVGRVEDLEASINFINNRIDCNELINKVEVKNESNESQKKYELTLDMTRSSLDLVNEKYKVDFELYKYDML